MQQASHLPPMWMLMLEQALPGTSAAAMSEVSFESVELFETVLPKPTNLLLYLLPLLPQPVSQRPSFSSSSLQPPAVAVVARPWLYQALLPWSAWLAQPLLPCRLLQNLYQQCLQLRLDQVVPV